jgi:hypothetical protein
LRPRSPERSLTDPISPNPILVPDRARLAPRRRFAMEAAMEVLTPKETDYTLKRARDMTRWIGRPYTGQRQLLDLFIAALVKDFEAGGPEAIEAVRRFDPVNYLRLVAVMVPRTLVDANACNEEYQEEVCDALDRVQELVDAYASGVDTREQGRRKLEATAALPALPEAD